MKMTNAQYGEYIKEKSPKSKLWPDILKAFAVGGLICCIGQLVYDLFSSSGLVPDDASAATSITMVFLGALLTGLAYKTTYPNSRGRGLWSLSRLCTLVVSLRWNLKARAI
jgi:stage V sporulation protein AC